jgi:hypothetical protein
MIFTVKELPYSCKAFFGHGSKGPAKSFIQLEAVSASAGDEAHDLDGLVALPGDGATQLRDPGGALELGPGRREQGLGVIAG